MSNDAAAPAAGDCAQSSTACTLASEIPSNGLSRAQGTYNHTAATNAFTITKLFSATGTQASQRMGLFNMNSSGTMVFENMYTQVAVNNGYTLTVTWTINY